MESKANPLYLRQLHLLLPGRCRLLLSPLLLLLLLLQLLASFPSTMANQKAVIINGDTNAGTVISYDLPDDDEESDSGNSIVGTIIMQDLINLPDEEEHNKGELFRPYEAEVWNQCPSVCQCPSTTILEPDDLNDVKVHLGSLIRKHVKNLLRKPTTIDAAIEAARIIDLLKILNESDPKFNAFRESMRRGTKRLRDALNDIPELKYE